MKPKARRFLLGLSFDELQFIAEYLGARILASGASGGDRRTVRFQWQRPERIAADRELKLILLREYLCRAGVQEVPAPISHSVN
jgi:hypothetical protein